MTFRLFTNRGMALIVVLALLVILTGIVVAYFSESSISRQLAHGTFSEGRADVLARSALDVIVADLKQEILNGSNPSTVNGYTVYTPTSSANMIPMRSGTASPTPTPAANMVRRSIRSDPIPAPGVASRASAVNSAIDISLNNRSVNPARWNKHYLVPRSTTGTAVDCTPIASFTAPDWVLVTRNGPVAFSSWNSSLKDRTVTNPTYTIGRYAFAIYDEGGLLDVNVAGFPSPAPSPSDYVRTIGRKGTLAFADLTVLPTSTASPAPTLPPRRVNNIVGWRNYASARPTGSIQGNSFVFDATSALNFLNWVATNSGFMTVSPATYNNNTDQNFVSRQELLAFRTAPGDIGFSQNALQYLGTFSRELNRPNWKPNLNATDMGAGNNGPGNIYAYKDNSANPAATPINANLPNVRVLTGSPGFVRSDGTSAVAGDPLFKNRFSLTRLGGIGPAGPDTTQNTTLLNGILVPASAATIQRDFGLLWNSGQNRWDYVGATGSTVQSTIERLDQVAGENREANFFEILKAVVLSGSTGLGSGAENTFVQSETKYYNAVGNFSGDHQIIQIGANIIDGWDFADNNVPTFIAFKDPATAEIYELAGIENLPYLNKLVFDFWIASHGSDDQHDQWSAWLVPSFWNPHQNAASAPSTQDVRFVMTSGSITGWLLLTDNTTYPTNTITSTGTTPFVEVKANSFATAYPPISTNEGGNPKHSVEFAQITQGSSPYDAIVLGDPIPIPKEAYKNVSKAYPMFDSSTTFAMQVNVNGTWKSYETWKNCSNGNTDPAPGSPFVVNQQTGNLKDVSIQDPEFVSLDPRTIRFGVWGSQASDYKSGSDHNYDGGAEDTMDQQARYGALEGIASTMRPQPPASFPMATPTGGKTYLKAYLYSANNQTENSYNDLDGVKRIGDWPSSSLDGISSTKTIMYGSASPPPTPSPTPRAVDRPKVPSAQNQSVAELGQVFRDQPWKTINFTTTNSADAGLLDAFTLQDTGLTAGRISLNTKQPTVLTAVLSKSGLTIDGSNIITSAQANALANTIVGITTANPLISKADLVTQIAGSTSFTALGNKEARECVMRALTDAGQTRTWSLLIDVIAQSGRYPPTATNLSEFIVEAERRYWLHVAIDRFTGEVIDQELEAVYE